MIKGYKVQDSHLTIEQALYGRSNDPNTGFNYYIADVAKMGNDAIAKFKRANSKFREKYGSYTRCMVINNISDGWLSSARQSYRVYKEIIKEYFNVSDELDQSNRLGRVRNDMYERYLEVFDLKDIYRLEPVKPIGPDESVEEKKPEKSKKEVIKEGSLALDEIKGIRTELSVLNMTLSEMLVVMKEMNESWKPKRSKPVAYLPYSQRNEESKEKVE